MIRATYIRMNAANVLAEAGRVDDAVAVLGAAVRLAKNPSQVSAAQHQIDNLRDFKQKQAEMERQRQAYVEQQKQYGNSAAWCTAQATFRIASRRVR